jgi:hypothetical protein
MYLYDKQRLQQVFTLPVQQSSHRGSLFCKSSGLVEGVAVTKVAIMATAMKVVNRENCI